MFGGLTGLIGSPTDVVTLLIVARGYAALDTDQTAISAYIVALARDVDSVDDDEAQSELDVEDRHVSARISD